MLHNSSIDDEEVKKFSKIASDWWNPQGKFKPLHQINEVRLKFIQDKIRWHFALEKQVTFSNISILDIGCGGGLITVPLYKLGADITAIDPAPENIISATQYAREQGLEINYFASTAEELQQQNKQYDVVVCLEVAEHVAELEHFMEAVATLVKPGGMLIISTINRTLKSYILAIVMAEYVLGWVPRNTHTYSKLLTPAELNMILNNNKIYLKELKGVTFSLLSQSWQLSRDISINYLGYFTKPH